MQYGEGNGTPLQCSCLGKSHGWRSLEGCSPWGRWGSDTTERLHFHALEKEMATHCSVLAWRIPGMGEPGGLPSMGSRSRAQLKRLSSSSSSSGYAISYFSFSVLLHSGWQSLGPSLLLQMALFPPLWRLSNVPFRDAPRRLHSFFCWWTFGCSHVWAAGSRAAANVGVHGPFRILLFTGYVPRSSGITGLYGRSIFTSQRNSILFSIVAAPIYIPTNNVGGFPSFQTLSSICCLWIFLVTAILTSVRW